MLIKTNIFYRYNSSINLEMRVQTPQQKVTGGNGLNSTENPEGGIRVAFISSGHSDIMY